VASAGPAATPSAEWRRLDVLGREPELLRNYARLSERKTDLLLAFPFRQEETVAVQLPEAWQVLEQPPDRVIESPFGRFEFSVKSGGEKVTARAQLELFRHRITAKEYPEFRKFCLAVDALVGQPLVVGKSAP
jgi:hypothetical protein